MSTLTERLAAYTIGTVLAVSPHELLISLDPEAPKATALNTGNPIGFPRINSCVLIANETGAVVGAVSHIAITMHATSGKLRRDDPLVALPFPMRVLHLTPLGTLIADGDGTEGQPVFRLARGVPVLPSVGDPVLLPNREQLRSIVEGHGADRRVWIGNAPFASNARVTIDPDKLFGRHLAVLGNTGSGKSCSVAGIIRWCLEAASTVGAPISDHGPNARFIVLDPNGEYANAFKADGLRCRTFSVGAKHGDFPVTVPGWLWNGQEWAAFTNAQPGTQRPVLMSALRALRNATPEAESVRAQIQRRCSGLLHRFKNYLDNFPDSVSGSYPKTMGFAEGLAGLHTGMLSDRRKLPDDPVLGADLKKSLEESAAWVEAVRSRRAWKTDTKSGFREFQQIDIEEVIQALQNVLSSFPPSLPADERSEDAPVPFAVHSLPAAIEDEARAIGGNALANVEPLINRIRVMLGDSRMAPIVAPHPDTTLFDWLRTLVGEDDAANGQVAVIDLSLVPSEVVHITVSVITRLIFEAVQRYKKSHSEGRPLPTTLVLEEAHMFIMRESEHGASLNAADTCRQTFERVAREGRKFGLGLLLSSQRPSELSSTVLAQCNTFLLHRIVNDVDQSLVRKLVPDTLGGLLSELPTLPSQQAILMGWATPLPILVRLRDLPKQHRPQSDDPDYWDVWTRNEERAIDWGALVREWEGPKIDKS